jgi:hypothetical protein
MPSAAASTNLSPFLMARYGKPKPTGNTSPLTQQYQTYGNAVNTDTSAFNGIMGGYQDLYNDAKSNTPQNVQFDPYAYKPYSYAPTNDYKSSVSALTDMSHNGGYSDSDVQNLRDRAVSPIRSIYANANRDIDRSRSLQGGYSPSYGALKAKMAREQSDSTGNALINANASIAEKQAEGRRGALSQLASTTASENALQNESKQKENANANEYGMRNTELGNESKRLQLQLPLQKSDQLFRILEGMRGLYGTSPAMSSTFGSQALSGANLSNTIRQQNGARGLDLVRQLIGGMN